MQKLYHLLKISLKYVNVEILYHLEFHCSSFVLSTIKVFFKIVSLVHEDPSGNDRLKKAYRQLPHVRLHALFTSSILT